MTRKLDWTNTRIQKFAKTNNQRKTYCSMIKWILLFVAHLVAGETDKELDICLKGAVLRPMTSLFGVKTENYELEQLPESIGTVLNNLGRTVRLFDERIKMITPPEVKNYIEWPGTGKRLVILERCPQGKAQLCCVHSGYRLPRPRDNNELKKLVYTVGKYQEYTGDTKDFYFPIDVQLSGGMIEINGNPIMEDNEINRNCSSHDLSGYSNTLEVTRMEGSKLEIETLAPNGKLGAGFLPNTPHEAADKDGEYFPYTSLKLDSGSASETIQDDRNIEMIHGQIVDDAVKLQRIECYGGSDSKYAYTTQRPVICEDVHPKYASDSLSMMLIRKRLEQTKRLIENHGTEIKDFAVPTNEETAEVDPKDPEEENNEPETTEANEENTRDDVLESNLENAKFSITSKGYEIMALASQVQAALEQTREGQMFEKFDLLLEWADMVEEKLKDWPCIKNIVAPESSQNSVKWLGETASELCLGQNGANHHITIRRPDYNKKVYRVLPLPNSDRTPADPYYVLNENAGEDDYTFNSLTENTCREGEPCELSAIIDDAQKDCAKYLREPQGPSGGCITKPLPQAKAYATNCNKHSTHILGTQDTLFLRVDCKIENYDNGTDALYFSARPGSHRYDTNCKVSDGNTGIVYSAQEGILDLESAKFRPMGDIEERSKYYGLLWISRHDLSALFVTIAVLVALVLILILIQCICGCKCRLCSPSTGIVAQGEPRIMVTKKRMVGNLTGCFSTFKKRNYVNVEQNDDDHTSKSIIKDQYNGTKDIFGNYVNSLAVEEHKIPLKALSPRDQLENELYRDDEDDDGSMP